jgi:Activator of Hsp90 ATPase homolog 1-like protein
MSTESAEAVEVVRSITVPLSPARAFELFTSRMTDFWPKEHSIGSAELVEVVVEPRVGGRWFERGVDGTECEWGRVAVWEPPRKVVLLWQIGANWQYDPDFETEVEVTFTEDVSAHARVQLRHTNLQRYGDAAEQMRAAFDDPNGWAGTLARFADLARSGAPSLTCEETP